MKEVKLLNEGDVIFRFGGWANDDITRYTIDRVTKTRAYTSDGRNGFTREYTNPDWIRTYPRQSGYRLDNHKLGTPELEKSVAKTLKRKRLVATVSKIRWSQVETDLIEQVLGIVPQEKP